jgi:hypothetical protein
LSRKIKIDGVSSSANYGKQKNAKFAYSIQNEN